MSKLEHGRKLGPDGKDEVYFRLHLLNMGARSKLTKVQHIKSQHLFDEERFCAMLRQATTLDQIHFVEGTM